MNLLFRDLFNEILKVKYNFHQQRAAETVEKGHTPFAKQANAGSALMQQESQINMESNGDDESKG